MEEKVTINVNLVFSLKFIPVTDGFDYQYILEHFFTRVYVYFPGGTLFIRGMSSFFNSCSPRLEMLLNMGVQGYAL